MTGSPLTPFPKLGTAFVDSDGSLARPWYRLLITMWQKLGAANSPNPSLGVYLAQAPGGGTPLTAFDSVTGASLGVVETSSSVGGPAEPQVLGASPFVFVAPTSGMLAANGGSIEISRNNGVTYYPVGFTGCGLRVLMLDRVRITYRDAANAPTVTFFPGS